MDLQLKNVYFSEQLSEETNAFTADIWFRGKKVGYAKNDGNGGCTGINAYPKQRENFNLAVEYAKSLEPIEYEGRAGLKGFTLDSNLEAQVNRLFENWLDKKELQKQQRKGIFYQKPDGTKATTYWKGWSIKKMLEHPQGKATIRGTVAKLRVEGNKILNTNLSSIIND